MHGDKEGTLKSRDGEQWRNRRDTRGCKIIENVEAVKRSESRRGLDQPGWRFGYWRAVPRRTL